MDYAAELRAYWSARAVLKRREEAEARLQDEVNARRRQARGGRGSGSGSGGRTQVVAVDLP